MSVNASGADAQLQEIRRRFEEDADFRKAADAVLEGTLRNAGLSDEMLNRFALSDTDEHGNARMGLRAGEKWVCYMEDNRKERWCINCQNL
jgi:hypothetical protein